MGANRIILLVAIVLIASAVDSPPTSAKEIIVDDDSEASFRSIQEAVNNSSSGDVIFVYPGIYNESVEVRVQNIQIMAKSGYPEVRSFTVSAGNVIINGFSVQQYITTSLIEVKNCSIKRNQFLGNNSDGTPGIWGEDCFNCTFSDNVLLNSSIELQTSGGTTNVTIANNTIQGGTIHLSGVSENKITNNTISNAILNTTDTRGITFFEAHDNYVANNHISNSNYGISMTRLSGNNNFVNNTLASNDVGISATDSASGNNITSNTITNNNIGIWMEDSSNNMVTDNKVELNRKYGVYLNQISYEAPYTGTTWFYNNIFNNTVNLFNDTSNHYTTYVMNYAGIVPVSWNTTKTAGTNVVSGPYLGGNYWAKPDGTGLSQTCNDWDRDGICDSLYTISVHDIDYLPLVSMSQQQSQQQQPVFPVANFSTNIISGYVPLSILFTDLSQNATSRVWDFNDDEIADSSDANPVYVYTASGTYTVNLTVSNANGTVSRLSAVTASTRPRYVLTETQITTYKSNQTKPAIYGNKIVWQDDRNGEGYTVFMYDLSTSRETQITTNKSWDWKPAIYGDRIVWQDSLDGIPYIHMYNISTSTETQIAPNKSWEPAIYEDRIVYTDTCNGNGDIYMYDLATSQETRITTNESHQGNPAIYGDRIVWQDSRNGEGYNPTDIYMYNISTSTETRITINDSDQYSPAIYGDRIVWEDYRNQGSDIYMYDLSTFKETRITTNEYNQWSPAIYGDRIVWTDERNGNGDIYMYDFSTSMETQITTNKSAQGRPAIYGDRIVWEDGRNGNSDIYMCTLSPNLPIAYFSANVTSGNAPLKVLFTDTGTGGAPTSWYWDFGDGVYSKHAMNATHTFTKPGVYNITLTVTNAAGSNNKTMPEYITISKSK